MYDAVPADHMHVSPIFDSDMEKFLPMLQNYLRGKPFSFATMYRAKPFQ